MFGEISENEWSDFNVIGSILLTVIPLKFCKNVWKSAIL